MNGYSHDALHSLPPLIAAVSVLTATETERHEGNRNGAARLLAADRVRLDELHPADLEPRPALVALGHGDLSAVRRDDLLDDRQSEAGAGLAGGEPVDEHLIAIVFGDPRAVVFDVYP